MYRRHGKAKPFRTEGRQSRSSASTRASVNWTSLQRAVAGGLSTFYLIPATTDSPAAGANQRLHIQDFRYAGWREGSCTRRPLRPRSG
jgi:hypothetical protein